MIQTQIIQMEEAAAEVVHLTVALKPLVTQRESLKKMTRTFFSTITRSNPLLKDYAAVSFRTYSLAKPQ
jgi:hypothetical protein